MQNRQSSSARIEIFVDDADDLPPRFLPTQMSPLLCGVDEVLREADVGRKAECVDPRYEGILFVDRQVGKIRSLIYERPPFWIFR